jgi:hypothetical protein
MLREMDEQPDRCGTIVAGNEGPGWQFGHLKRGARGDLCPEGGYKGSAQGFNPVSTLGTAAQSDSP